MTYHKEMQMNLRTRSSRRMDFEVTAKMVLSGALLQLVAQSSFVLGSGLWLGFFDECTVLATILVTSLTLITMTYVLERNPAKYVRTIVKSGRMDLFLAMGVGAGVTLVIVPYTGLEKLLLRVDHTLTSLILVILSVSMGASLLRGDRTIGVVEAQEGFAFLSDEEIEDADLDLLNSRGLADKFASIVATESARGAIVFGVDGPWGIGKSTFVNFAQRTWEANERVIVFRFEPLKYAAEKDLVRSFIQELSGELRSRFFAPELRPLASRYARILKADPSISFPGLKLSVDPDGSTIDEIVSDVSQSLERVGKRVIVVIDDLDRIDHETVKRVLFMIRRSMPARNVTYVLVYDTERLVSRSGNEETREYMEKFVNAKISLFVDLEALGSFLREGWKTSLPQGQSRQSTRVFGLQSILSELASILEGSSGGQYVGLMGNIRKIKRLINAMLLMEMEFVELNQTDFDRRDLVHLLLLYLIYPGIFRDIYASEGENRLGMFSLRPVTGHGGQGYENDPGLAVYLDRIEPAQRYLVAQLFEVGARDLINQRPSREQINTLACFNSFGRRNLSAYLRLIVRSVVPDPLQTEALYEGLLARARSGEIFKEVLDDTVLKENSGAHAKFWGALAASAKSFDQAKLVEAISTIVRLLPSYESKIITGTSPRSSAVYSLAIIINSAFGDIIQGDAAETSRAESIRALILGEGEGEGLFRALASPDRGILGIHDMLLFRLLCCADRGNQLRNIHLALVPSHLRNRLPSIRNSVVVEGVRQLSQIAFGIFKARYIDQGLNLMEPVAADTSVDPATQEVVVEDSFGKGFIAYQLTNTLAPTGSGVGCGYFDEAGSEDDCGISRVMNGYLFAGCFVPTSEANRLAFADYCLANFSRDYFDDSGPGPTRQSLEQGLDPQAFRDFWREYGHEYRASGLELLNRKVVTANYSATYQSDLLGVWDVLDKCDPIESAEDESALGLDLPAE